MFKLSRIIKIGLALLLGSFILLFGFCNSNFSIHTSKQQLTSDKKARPVNWLKPTGGDYPKIGRNEPIWIKVYKKKQRVYIIKGNKTIYAMVCSTGLDTSPDTSTPEGTFHIQQE